MVDFGKYINDDDTSVNSKDILALYGSKDTIASHTEPRPSQIEAFDFLTKNYDEKSIVLKLSTGIGKTAIGLFYLQSKMETSGRPVVYLCPTSQLKEQVLNESKKLGIIGYDYKEGERHPDPECIMGKSIIICTYDKLFNGNSVFEHSDVNITPYAIVLDDAHAGLERIKKSYSIASKNIEARSEFIKLFDEEMTAYHPIAWDSVKTNYPYESIEIPYWIIAHYEIEISKILTKYSSEKYYTFSWPLIKNHLRWCRFIIGPKEFHIQPITIPIANSKSFQNSEFKLFLTATLADDSILIKDLGLESSALKKIPRIESDKGIGERMIIVPSLINHSVDSGQIKAMCKEFSSKYSVVVLCSSKQQAQEWEEYGAKVYQDSEVNRVIPKLQSSENINGIHVFTQRFDGIDLPDASCRILVIDGLPYGESLLEKNDFSRRLISSNHNNITAYRIEQGMGRAVRSPSDFAAIILLGSDMANFIAKKEVMESMSYGTRLQIELAFELAKITKNEGKDPKNSIEDLIRQCLNRDENWKKFYARKVKIPISNYQYSTFTENDNFHFAIAERKSFEMTNLKDCKRASDIIIETVDKRQPSNEKKGYYLQLAANYLFEYSPSNALEMQRAAFEKNDTLLRPERIIKRPKIIASNSSIETFLSWYNQFENSNGPIVELHRIRAELSYSIKPKRFENGLRLLAPLLGATGFRPEQDYSEGPDVLWSWPTYDLIIEAKNENEEYIHKKDIEQLLFSIQWYKKNYQARPEPKGIIVAKAKKTDSNVSSPIDLYILTPEKMALLLSNIEKHLIALADFPLLNQASPLFQEKIKHKLTEDLFMANYTEKIY